MATKPPSKRQPKFSKNQTELRVLKRAGLWSGDWRKAKVPTGAQKRLRAKFKDDIAGLQAGTVKTVKVKGAKRSEVAKDLKLTRGRVTVRAKPDEILRYDPKTKMVVSTLKRYGVTYRRLIVTPRATSLSDLPKGKNIRYQVPFREWGIESPLFSSIEELQNFMSEYEKDKVRANGKVSPGFKNWLDYIEVLERVGSNKPEALADEVALQQKRPPKRKKKMANRSRPK